MGWGGLAVFIARGDLAGDRVDEHVERLGKGGTALDVMIADQPKGATLGEDRCFIIERAVAKVKGEPRSNPVAMSDLNEITCGESGTVERFENEESMKGSLCSTDRNRIGEHLRRYEKA
jgi:hypothetical protein